MIQTFVSGVTHRGLGVETLLAVYGRVTRCHLHAFRHHRHQHHTKHQVSPNTFARRDSQAGNHGTTFVLFSQLATYPLGISHAPRHDTTFRPRISKLQGQWELARVSALGASLTIVKLVSRRLLPPPPASH
jgi:hypothetical protein